jgi:orotidine-5'-phosphate decarboxylase
MKKTRLIVALDVPAFAEAKKLVDKLYPTVKFFKIGSQLFTACGSRAVDYVRRKGGKVFLDLKFHDIPNTVAHAVTAAASLDVFMLTVHASGGREMLKAAQEAAVRAGKKKPRIIAVTVLTSQEASADQVLALARMAAESGVDGIVASVREAAVLRRELSKDLILVTPGIRPSGPAGDDQKRTASVEEAVAAGSDFIVVGRPIVKADDPLAAARRISKDLNKRALPGD